MTDFTVTRAEERWFRWLQERERDLQKEAAEFWEAFSAARDIAPGAQIEVNWKARTFTMKLPEVESADPPE